MFMRTSLRPVEPRDRGGGKSEFVVTFGEASGWSRWPLAAVVVGTKKPRAVVCGWHGETADGYASAATSSASPMIETSDRPLADKPSRVAERDDQPGNAALPRLRGLGVINGGHVLAAKAVRQLVERVTDGRVGVESLG
jgi:hypothetical protein